MSVIDTLILDIYMMLQQGGGDHRIIDCTDEVTETLYSVIDQLHRLESLEK